jgi:hypothetical protein
MGRGLDGVAEVLDCGQDEVVRVATDRMRDVGDHLIELGRAMRASGRVVRHSVLWRSQRRLVDSVTDDARHLQLLGPGYLLFIRTAISASPPERRVLRKPMRQLARLLTELATDPGDVDARQRAVDRVLDVARSLARETAPVELPMAAAVASLRMITYDIMVYAGVDVDHAATGVRDGSARLPPTTPVESRRIPFFRSATRWRGPWRGQR